TEISRPGPSDYSSRPPPRSSDPLDGLVQPHRIVHVADRLLRDRHHSANTVIEDCFGKSDVTLVEGHSVADWRQILVERQGEAGFHFDVADATAAVATREILDLAA